MRVTFYIKNSNEVNYHQSNSLLEQIKGLKKEMK